jgi:membrane dipeptidase
MAGAARSCQPGPVNAHSDALHRDAVVADTHNDLLMLVTRREPGEQAGYFRDRWLPQLQAGGVDIQVLPIYIDDEFRPEGALRQTLRMLEAGRSVIEANSDAVRLCLTGADITATLASGRIACILALEGCEAIGTDIELLTTLFRIGVRMASFTHFGRTALADGSGEDDTASRLTRAGIDALALMQSIGMVMDVSHLSAAGVDHVLELSTRPVVASHSSAYGLRAHHRNLTDERLKGVAATGGVIGVNFFHGFLDEDFANTGVARVVDHIEYVAAAAGIEHVGLGPDFLKEIFDETLPPHLDELIIEGMDARKNTPGLEGPAGLPLVTAEMVSRGWPEGDIRRVLGENWQRVLTAELGYPHADR